MILIGNIIFAVIFVLSVLIAGCTLMEFVDFLTLIMLAVPLAIYCGLNFKESIHGLKIFFALKFPPVYGDDVHKHEKTAKFFARLACGSAIYGFLVMLLGVAIMLQDLNPSTIGTGMAIGLLSFMYSSYLALFVFLPISLRSYSVLPQNYTTVWSRRSSIWINIILVFCTVTALFIIRWMFLLMLVALDPKNSANLIPALFFSFNPVERYFGTNDLTGIFPLKQWIDSLSIVAMISSILIFKMISGKQYQKCIIPFCLLVGLLWTDLGCVIMIGNMNPKLLSMGFMLTMLPLVYGAVAAIYYLVRMKREPLA